MYGWIWNKLPFGLPGKIIGSLLLVAIAVWLLWYQLFPAIEPLLPFDDVQVEGPPQPGGGGTPTGPVEPTPDGSIIPT